MSAQKATICYSVNSRLSQRKSANIVWEKTFYVRCCRQQLVNVLRVQEKNSAWLKSSAQVKRFMVGILHQKCTVKRAITETCNLFCNIQCCKTKWKAILRVLTITKETLPPLYYSWKTGSYVAGKMRDIAIIIHLVLQQCCKTSCTFFVPSLLSFRAKQGNFGKKAPQVFILLLPSYRFPRVIDII